MLRRLGILIALLGMTLHCTSTADAQAGDADSSEYLIKAGFIYNFAKFVEWPSATFSQPDSPIVIGVLGRIPLEASSIASWKTRKLEHEDLLLSDINGEKT
jgi:hypothetical protein